MLKRFKLILAVCVGTAAASFSIALTTNAAPPDNHGNGKPVKAQCNDKSDNDLDGKIDYPNDPGCLSASDNDETDSPPPPPPPPSGTITQSIQSGATLSGQVDWHAVYDANADGVEDDPGSVRFYLDGVSIRTEVDPPFGSEPNNPAVTFWDSTTTTNGSHTFRTEAVDDAGTVLVSSPTVTANVDNTVAPPPPPPPPPSGTPLFDGQATRMNSITGSTVKVGDSNWNGSSNASQDPHIWGYKETDIASGVYCMTDSCQVVSDPTYGKVYRFNIGPGDTNPYFNQPTKPNGELTIQRPIAMGQVDWYAESFKIVSPYTMTGLYFNVIAQYGYPSLASPPLSISFEGNSLGIDRHVGMLNAPGDLTGAYIEKPRFYSLSSIYDKWVELVIGVKWSMDNTGWVEVYGRVRENGETTFSQKFVHLNTVTFQQIKGQPIKTTVNDKIGLYFGDESPPPTNTVLHRGFTRWDNKDDAIASMG